METALKTIVLPEDAGRVLGFAAAELQKYLRQMTGAAVAIKRKAPGASTVPPAVYLGAGEWDRAMGFRSEANPGPEDGFVIRTAGDRLFIRGRNPRSVLYGVYALLEQWGCEFVEPGIETIPPRKDLPLPDKEIRETAAFALRNIYAAPNQPQKLAPFKMLNREVMLPQIDWMAKMRLNHWDFYVNFYRYDLWEKHKGEVLDALLDRGIDLEVTHHSLHYFCPPDENHDFGDYGPETYLRNHPDWYLPGLECGSRGRWQTRVELPAVRNIIIKRFLEYVAANPELKIVGLWPDDIPINRPWKNLSHTDGYMTFWNEAGAALAKAFPDKLCGIIGYFDLTPPPEKVKPRGNLHCWYCPISRNLMYPIEHPRNANFLKWLKGWIKAMPPYRVGSFEYYGWQMELTPLRHSMKRDLPLYHDLKLGGIYGWSAFGNNLLGEDKRWAIDMVVLAKLMWDTGTAVRGIEETWARNVFGAAGGEILAFYDYLGKEHAREVKNGLAPVYQWIAFPVVHKVQAILAAARKKAATPAIRRRVDLLEKVLLRGSAEELWREGDARLF